jgi:xylulokinase
MSIIDDRYVLAVDLGTGSLKAVLVSNRARVLASAQRPIRTIEAPRGGAEQDPAEWWTALVGAARETIAAAGVPVASIVAIKCATQWAVTTPVDGDGNALGNAISWMDTRGGRYTRDLVGGPVRAGGYDLFKLWRWIRLSGGCPVRSGVDGLGHVLYLKNERPEIYAATRAFLEPMDYLNLRLTGRCAASFGTIFPYWLTDNRDPRRIDYHPTLLRLAGIGRDKLPELLPVDAVLGPLLPEVAEDLGLPPSTKVLMGVCDGHAATVGAGAVDDYEGYFYIGTSSWLSCHVPFKKTDLSHFLLSMPAAVPGRYMVAAEQGTAGRCLDFLVDRILFPRDDGAGAGPDAYAVLEREAGAVAPGCDGLIFTPWLGGVLVPEHDPHTRSAFFNQTMRITRGHYARAVMEGVAFNLRWLRGYVERFVGRPFPHLRFVGGAALSATWCQILADVLGCPVWKVANPRHATAVGAALAALAALGEIDLAAAGRGIEVEEVYQPNPATRRLYDEAFEHFLELYKRTKPVYEKLNGERRHHV